MRLFAIFISLVLSFNVFLLSTTDVVYAISEIEEEPSLLTTFTTEEQEFINKVTPIVTKYMNAQPEKNRIKFIKTIHTAVMTKYATLPLIENTTNNEKLYTQANNLYLVSIVLEDLLATQWEENFITQPIDTQFHQQREREDKLLDDFCIYVNKSKEIAVSLGRECDSAYSDLFDSQSAFQETLMHSVRQGIATEWKPLYAMVISELDQAILLLETDPAFKGDNGYKDRAIKYFKTKRDMMPDYLALAESVDVFFKTQNSHNKEQVYKLNESIDLKRYSNDDSVRNNQQALFDRLRVKEGYKIGSDYSKDYERVKAKYQVNDAIVKPINSSETENI